MPALHLFDTRMPAVPFINIVFLFVFSLRKLQTKQFQNQELPRYSVVSFSFSDMFSVYAAFRSLNENFYSVTSKHISRND